MNIEGYFIVLIPSFFVVYTIIRLIRIQLYDLHAKSNKFRTKAIIYSILANLYTFFVVNNIAFYNSGGSAETDYFNSSALLTLISIFVPAIILFYYLLKNQNEMKTGRKFLWPILLIYIYSSNFILYFVINHAISGWELILSLPALLVMIVIVFILGISCDSRLKDKKKSKK